MKWQSFSDNIYWTKAKDIIDFKSLTCWISLIFSIAITIISMIIIKNTSCDFVAEENMKYLDSISFSLIGFLGFIVTGLAILTGGISSKVYIKLKEVEQSESIDNILSSFYLLGAVTVLTILFAFCCHFLTVTEIRSDKKVVFCLIFVFSYFVSFILVYAVKLIRNCLELLKIINEFEALFNDNCNSVNKKNEDSFLKYDKYRLLALEKIILSNQNMNELGKYKKSINELIVGDINSTIEEKKEYIQILEGHFKPFEDKKKND